MTAKSDFLWVGGHPALDFINTAHVSAADEIVDRLGSPEDVVSWAEHAGLAVARDPRTRRRTNTRVCELRSALRQLVEASLDGARPKSEAVSLVSALAAARLPGAELRYERGGYRLSPTVLQDPLDVVRLVARLGAELLASPDMQRVRRCGSDRCVLLFLDRSKAGKRKWCSMELCGNRAKVAAHHRRQRSVR